MNYESLFNRLIDLAYRQSVEFLQGEDNEPLDQLPSPEEIEDEIEEMLGKSVVLPKPLPADPSHALVALRSHLEDDVAMISYTLASQFPNQYVYYRPKLCDIEIISGLNAILEEIQAEPLPFEKVGQRGLDRYLQLNEVLQTLAPNELSGEARQAFFIILMFDIIAPIFATPVSTSRKWLMATDQVNWHELDERSSELDWSGSKTMRPNDVVFMYRTSPRSAITDILRVREEGTHFDPSDYWGERVLLEHIISIEDISFRAMRDDKVLGQWGLIQRQLQGVRCEPIPYRYFNRLLELMSPEERAVAGLVPEAISSSSLSGVYESEAEFEDSVIESLLRKLDFTFKRQHECTFYVGSQSIRGRIDYLVSDHQGALTVFENKLTIVNDKQHQIALRQARSYALYIGTPSFVVAAPEGLWLYRLERHREYLEAHFDLSAMEAQQIDELRDHLLKLGKRRTV